MQGKYEYFELYNLQHEGSKLRNFYYTSNLIVELQLLVDSKNEHFIKFLNKFSKNLFNFTMFRDSFILYN